MRRIAVEKGLIIPFRFGPRGKPNLQQLEKPYELTALVYGFCRLIFI